MARTGQKSENLHVSMKRGCRTTHKGIIVILSETGECHELLKFAVVHMLEELEGNSNDPRVNG
jgi:hypothetical protein